jgi:uncharacterized cupin superfamily protein
MQRSNRPGAAGAMARRSRIAAGRLARVTAPEARLEDEGHGLAPSARGWFVVNLADARGRGSEKVGTWTELEPPEAFEDYGIGVHVLQPGQANGRYHEEDNQEDFLVLVGECVVIVEEQERHLKAWDFVHCPRGTRHIFVGAGDGPCAILMVGTRRPGLLYPVSEVAAHYGASVQEPTTTSRQAYAGDPPHTDVRFPWPL